MVLFYPPHTHQSQNRRNPFHIILNTRIPELRMRIMVKLTVQSKRSDTRLEHPMFQRIRYPFGLHQWCAKLDAWPPIAGMTIRADQPWRWNSFVPSVRIALAAFLHGVLSIEQLMGIVQIVTERPPTDHERSKTGVVFRSKRLDERQTNGGYGRR